VLGRGSPVNGKPQGKQGLLLRIEALAQLSERVRKGASFDWRPARHHLGRFFVAEEDAQITGNFRAVTPHRFFGGPAKVTGSEPARDSPLDLA